MTDQKKSTREIVKDLVARHGVTYEKTYGDLMADKFTELSGDDVIESDETSLLLIALRRAEIIDKGTWLNLFFKHMNEREEDG